MGKYVVGQSSHSLTQEQLATPTTCCQLHASAVQLQNMLLRRCQWRQRTHRTPDATLLHCHSERQCTCTRVSRELWWARWQYTGSGHPCMDDFCALVYCMHITRCACIFLFSPWKLLTRWASETLRLGARASHWRCAGRHCAAGMHTPYKLSEWVLLLLHLDQKDVSIQQPVLAKDAFRLSQSLIWQPSPGPSPHAIILDFSLIPRLSIS